MSFFHCFVPPQQVEYAQLNHDTNHHGDRGNQGDQSVQEDHIDEIDIDSVHVDAVDRGEAKQDDAPAC